MKKIKGKLLALILCFVMIGASATPAVQTFADQTVYITKTGECYHAYAHGNGTFTATTLSNAISKGLRPCKVCGGSLSTSASTTTTSKSTTATVKTPAKVSSLKETSASTTSISLSWKKAKNCTGYEVYTSTKKGSGFKKVKTISKNSTVTYTMKKASGKKLAANKSYYVKVRAINKSGGTVKYGKYSSVLKVYTSPEKTSSFKCTDYDSTSISVEWKKVTGATGYYVVVYDSEEDEADEAVTKDLSADFNDLSEGETYTVTVSAYKQVKVAGKTLKLYGPEKSLTLTLPEEDLDFDDDDADGEED